MLRRNALARAVQGSNSIEGYSANLPDAIAIVDNERPESLADETAKALAGYRAAMTYIIRLHNDPHATINAQLIRSLHFMMLNHDMTMLPGQWRPGPIYVVRAPEGETVYEGPDASHVPTLIEALVAQIATPQSQSPTLVTAALAHLNLAMIHPFKDGNGRMARALQTLVLSRGGIVSPEFCSIEEWLGRNTQAYYAILEATGQGRWSPDRDALPWVRFCLVAHYQQAHTIRRRSELVGRVWTEIERITTGLRLNDRVLPVLVDAAYGYRVTNQRHRTEAAVSEVVASRDLKLLCDVGLLVPVGEKRGRHYVAGAKLHRMDRRLSDGRRAPDPYAEIRARRASAQLQLPLNGSN
jgi:Fic family protein